VQGMTVAFINTETTGLDPDRHEIWEVGLILPDGTEREWQLPVDLSRADPMALNIGLFHERRAKSMGVAPGVLRNGVTTSTPSLAVFATDFVDLTRGLHLVGAVVSFDTDRLWRLLRANGQCPMWHYHVIDVEALAAGWLKGRQAIGALYPETVRASDVIGYGRPPWNSNDLSRAVGVNPEDFDRHTALGDARWAKAMYEAVMV
jgi:DNA polymerase III epsilon subunit-like protein